MGRGREGPEADMSGDINLRARYWSGVIARAGPVMGCRIGSSAGMQESAGMRVVVWRLCRDGDVLVRFSTRISVIIIYCFVLVDK